MDGPEELMTSEEWNKSDGPILVIDPDGWPRDDRFKKAWFEDKISWREFERKAMMSTCQWKAGGIR